MRVFQLYGCIVRCLNNVYAERMRMKLQRKHNPHITQITHCFTRSSRQTYQSPVCVCFYTVHQAPPIAHTSHERATRHDK